MSTSKDLRKYREIIEEAVVAMGRDDVGVGEVSEDEGGMLLVNFSRGAHSAVEEIPVDMLRDREHANQAVVKAIRGLSKEVFHETMDRA